MVGLAEIAALVILTVIERIVRDSRRRRCFSDPARLSTD